jgi:hypothetical protein
MLTKTLEKAALKIAREETDEAIELAFKQKTLGAILLRNKDLLAESLMELSKESNNILQLELLYRRIKAIKKYGENYYPDEGAGI